MSVLEQRAASRVVEWSRLSPRGRELVRVIALRFAAGYSFDEIADMIEESRSEIRADLELPRGRVTKGWVSARFRELRRELEEVTDGK